LYKWTKLQQWICINNNFNATISIATLKDSYTVNELIKLTDPPDNILVNNVVTNKNSRNRNRVNNLVNKPTQIKTQSNGILSNLKMPLWLLKKKNLKILQG